ncbi:MAG TPA: MATE family efflux transporter [Candidatus Blautia gallistercoris]|uniref:MATE family efflux transporter n=1 Tax=Candidatus Blautia gallistercoris TaxID=2838490 RepID=A0A9D2B2W9_9FIRM|nr:MATE family efflux transporter [Candidatus Blautia gallistercoris]
MKKNATNQITEGVIWKQLLLFFFPIVLGTFFQQIYNTADAIVVGRYVGKEALASVGGSTSQIINLVVGFFVGLSSGATVVIAQFYGARDQKNINRALHTAIAFSIAGSIVITILGLLFSPFFLQLMQTPQNLMADSTLYLRVYFAGIFFVFIYNIGSGILRATGDSRRPLYFLIVCCFLNIILDVVFVVGLHMAVAGVALGTLISQGVSAVLVLIALFRSRDIFRLRLKELHFHRASLQSLLRIGIPAGLQSVMYNISNVIIQACLNTFGTDTVAAWTAFGKMDAFYWMVCSAFGIAITTFIGQNYGAGKYNRMRKSVRICFAMAMGSSIAISAVLLIFGSYIFQIFTGDAIVVEIGMEMVRFMVPFYSIYVFIEILSGALRGTGNVLIPMLMTCGGVCLLRLIWIIVMLPIHREIITIIFSYPISWSITALMFIFYYLRESRKWPKV